MKRLGFSIVLAMVGLGVLSGCASIRRRPVLPKQQKIVQRRQALRGDLIHRGVQVIRVGDEIKLILPSDNFFRGDTPVLGWNADSTLAIAADYLRTFNTVSISVVGYMNKQCSKARDYALSSQRADNVADALWQRGLDTRLLVVAGRGQCRPIALGRYAAAKNRRIEITTRQVVE